MAATAPDNNASLTDEDRLRADMYALLGELLRKEPSDEVIGTVAGFQGCLLYTSPSPRDATLSRMPSSA